MGHARSDFPPVERPSPADIILYPVTGRSGWTSKMVAIGEMLFGAGKGLEQYSHAAIVSWTPGFQFEAKFPLTGLFPVDKSRPYEVWRVEGITEAQRKEVLRWCMVHIDELYNMVGLLTFGLLGFKHTAVCSQFVGKAYAAAGIHISPEGKRLLSPNAIADFHRSKLVARVLP